MAQVKIHCPNCDKVAKASVYSWERDEPVYLMEAGWELEEVAPTCECAVAEHEWVQMVEIALDRS